MKTREGHFRFQRFKLEDSDGQHLSVFMGEVHHSEDAGSQMFLGASRGNHKLINEDFHCGMGGRKLLFTQLLLFYLSVPISSSSLLHYSHLSCSHRIFSTLQLPFTCNLDPSLSHILRLFNPVIISLLFSISSSSSLFAPSQLWYEHVQASSMLHNVFVYIFCTLISIHKTTENILRAPHKGDPLPSNNPSFF